MTKDKQIRRFVPSMKEVIKIAAAKTNELPLDTTLTVEAFIARVEGLRFRLVETWCVAEYFFLYGVDNPKRLQYTNQLVELIEAIRRVSLVGEVSKRDLITTLLIDTFDYNDASMVEQIARDEFNTLGLVNGYRNSIVYSYFTCAIYRVIDVMCEGDFKATTDYVKRQFDVDLYPGRG